MCVWEELGGGGVTHRKEPAGDPERGHDGSQSYRKLFSRKSPALLRGTGRRKPGSHGLTHAGMQPSKLSEQCKE